MNAMTETVSSVDRDRLLPLFVDLDGTLIKTDVAVESLARALRKQGAFRAALAGRSENGLSGLKRALATEVPPEIANLPYCEEVLTYIRAARKQGRKVVLATAADSLVARAVAAHLDLFDDIIASEPGHNLKGAAKLAAIRQMAPEGFEYLGDSGADVPIWQAATQSGYVRPTRAAARHMNADAGKVSFHVARGGPPFAALWRAMRPHQWAKNVLVFVPLLFAHRYGEPGEILAAVMAFVLFSLCASAVYLINDMADIEADRRHRTKCKRPFAAGELSIATGLAAAGGLLLGSFALALAFLSWPFVAVLAGYLVLTTAYTFVLKRYSTIDVVALSLLYTVRIIAGAAATAIVPSPWLLSYSLFFFLSLAYMKRYIELARAEEGGKLPSRNYFTSDLSLVQTFGIANGALSVLTLAQYVTSDKVVQSYSLPILLWLIVPVMMFWTYRTWTWASRGKIGDDPVVFALRDRISRICVMVVLAIVLVAHYATI